MLGEISQDHTGLCQLFRAVDEHWRFAHFVDAVAPFRRALHAFAEESTNTALPIGADQIEHQRGAVRVAGLGETVQLIFGHIFPAICLLCDICCCDDLMRQRQRAAVVVFSFEMAAGE